MSTTEIGKRIKQAREAKRITQERLGNYLGLNKSSIQRYETGKVEKIKLPILENIAFILGVNPSWLALKTDDPQYYGELTSAPGSIIGSIEDFPESSDITSDEKHLLDYYRGFNDEGKEKLLDTASDMAQLDRYKKDNQSQSVSKDA